MSNKPLKNEEPEKEGLSTVGESKKHGYVELPFNHEQFKDFIVSLLGKPQTISKNFKGQFTIELPHLINIHHLIEQRIMQQNKAELIQFRTRIVYSDGSSILLNSFEEFTTFNEVKPLVSSSIHLNWQYMVKFMDKKSAERQEIELSVISSTEKDMIFDSDFEFPLLFSFNNRGLINLRIKHTARTWGSDLEGLLSNHIQTFITPINKINKFIEKNKAIISVFMPLVSIVGYLLYLSHSANIEKTNNLIQIKKLLEKHNSLDIYALNQKIDYMLNFIVINSDKQSYFSLFILIMIMISSTMLIFWTIECIENITRESSFLLLTTESKRNKEKVEKNIKIKIIKNILYIIFSLVLNIAGSILGSYFVSQPSSNTAQQKVIK